MLRLGLALFVASLVPTGTEIHIRLTDKISSAAVKVNDKVAAVVIEPVIENDVVAIPSGTTVSGLVKEVQAADTAKQQATLLLDFPELHTGGLTLKIATRVLSVDNARETVDDAGKIIGPVPSETLTSRIDQGLSKLNQKYAGLAGILEAAKGALIKDTDPNISYEPGVEMTLTLTKPLEMKAAVKDPHVAGLKALPNEAALIELVNRQPFQTYAQNPPRKSDITNVMFIGSREALEAAFTEAGWSGAAALGSASKLQTAFAIIEQRGYKEAPVSVLILDDRPPDLVFQKGNNTFAARHHLRIWRSLDKFQGLPVWICSSTHDTGIDFSQRDMTFIHRIDPNIDAERAKVVNDLLFAGKVKSLALVERPRVPEHAQNATGDKLDTDGRMAVLLLQ